MLLSTAGTPIVERNLNKYENVYLVVQATIDKWDEHRDWRISMPANFYNTVCGAGLITTGYLTKEALDMQTIHDKEPTKDHFLSPRLGYYALMDKDTGNPELLKNRETLFPLVDLFRHTVGTTGKQNNNARFNPDKLGAGYLPIVKRRTIDKYNHCEWYKNGEHGTLLVEEAGFPLNYIVPDWFTAFEEKCMRHHGYMKRKFI